MGEEDEIMNGMVKTKEVQSKAIVQEISAFAAVGTLKVVLLTVKK